MFKYLTSKSYRFFSLILIGKICFFHLTFHALSFLNHVKETQLIRLYFICSLFPVQVHFWFRLFLWNMDLFSCDKERISPFFFCQVLFALFYFIYFLLSFCSMALIEFSIFYRFCMNLRFDLILLAPGLTLIRFARSQSFLSHWISYNEQPNCSPYSYDFYS